MLQDASRPCRRVASRAISGRLQTSILHRPGGTSRSCPRPDGAYVADPSVSTPTQNPPRRYPRESAPEILALLRVRAGHRDDPAAAGGSRQPLPDTEALAQMLETAFFATLTDDEGRPTLFRLVFVEPDAAQASGSTPILIELRPFTVEALRRLAAATTSTNAAIGVYRDDQHDLVIWGIIPPAPATPAGAPLSGLLIDSRGRGWLDINLGDRRIASYVRGILRLYDQHLDEAELTRVISDIAPGIAGAPPHAELLVVLRIADAMTSPDHGGTLLVVADGHYSRVPALRPSPRFPLRPAARGFLSDAHAYQLARADVATPLADHARVDGDRRETDRVKARYARRAIEQAVQLVAGLTAIDGAVVITANLEVVAFGAMIDVAPDPDLSDVATIDPAAPDITRRRLPMAFGGARHQSAIAFCRQQPDGALAFVCSQDGILTLFIGAAGDVLALRPLDLSATR
jgi:hypothetical protein